MGEGKGVVSEDVVVGEGGITVHKISQGQEAENIFFFIFQTILDIF